MLQIGRHTDYAARLVLHLIALGEGTSTTIAEVSAERLLPAPYVRRLLSKLTKAGLVKAERGKGGGIRLARPAASISLLDVVEAMEGPIALNRCVKGSKGCPLAGSCPVQCSWKTINQTLRDSFAAVRFADLAKHQGHSQAHARLHSCSMRKPRC